MRTYEVRRTETSVPLTGDVNGTVWENAAVANVDSFTWSEGEPGPKTVVRGLHDGEALSLQFHAEDDEIAAAVTELNGPTFRDSSVEFFANPVPDDRDMYFNFEVNCCGTFKLAWQEYDWRAKGIGRDEISSSLAEEIDVETSVPGPTKEPRPDDESWWVAVRLPVSTLAAFTGCDVSVGPDTTWLGNFYRSGVPDHRKATWNPIRTDEPEYHSPEYFGRIAFG